MTDFYFKIFNATWTVSFVDRIEKEDSNDDSFSFGRMYCDRNSIQIATKDSKGNRLPEDTIKLTLYHEMFHAILFAGQYNNSCGDEPLVEWLANCIFSLKKQGKL